MQLWLAWLFAPFHLITFGTNHLYFPPALSHLLPLPFLLQPNGPGGGPNTLCAVSVLLSQYFLVCSHPVSVWSALLPTSQNKTSLQSGWHNEPLSGLPFLHTAVLTVADHNRVQGGRRGVIFY